MNLLTKASGLSSPLRLRVGDEIRQFPRAYVLVGRDPRADIVLDSPDVRRLHAYLQCINGRVFCVSLAGPGAIRWENGSKASSGWLDRNQRTCIGGLVLRSAGGFGGGEGMIDHRAQVDSRNALAIEFPGPPAVLEIARNGADSQSGGSAAASTSVRLVGRVLTLMGRAADCELALSHPSVSTYHAALLWTSMGLWIVDLLGQAGVSVNGVRVRSARLSDGDSLTIGQYSVRVRFDAQFRARPALGTVPLPASDSGIRPAALDVAPTSMGLPVHAAVRPLPAVAALPAVAEPLPMTVAAGSPGQGTEVREWVPPENDVLLSSMMLMMNQFGMLQQRKLDQFLLSVMSKIETSTTVIRDEQEAIRRDLESLRDLAEDFGRVKTELASLRSVLESRTGLAGLPATIGERAGAAEADANGEFYDWLSRRVESLQDEHQTLWQRIVNSMIGRQTNENAAP